MGWGLWFWCFLEFYCDVAARECDKQKNWPNLCYLTNPLAFHGVRFSTYKMGMVTSAFTNTHRIFGQMRYGCESLIYICNIYILRSRCYVTIGAVIIIINHVILSLKKCPLCFRSVSIGGFWVTVVAHLNTLYPYVNHRHNYTWKMWCFGQEPVLSSF